MATREQAKSDSVILAVRISPADRTELKTICAAKGISIQKLFSDFLREWVAKNKD